MEPEIVNLRETIRRFILKAFIPVRSYAKRFEPFLEVYNIDINAYVK